MAVTAELINSIFALSRCMREKTGGKSQVNNLSMVQLQTLVFLAKEKTASVKIIAEYLHVELSSASTLLDTLATLRFIAKTTDKKDKRSTVISLTLKGKKLLQKAKKEKERHLQRFLATLSVSEQKQLLFLLNKLMSGLQEAHEK